MRVLTCFAAFLLANGRRNTYEVLRRTRDDLLSVVQPQIDFEVNVLMGKGLSILVMLQPRH